MGIDPLPKVSGKCYEDDEAYYTGILKQYVIQGAKWKELKGLYHILFSFKKRGIKNNAGWALAVENKVNELYLLKD